jgi:hypothetical protein
VTASQKFPATKIYSELCATASRLHHTGNCFTAIMPKRKNQSPANGKSKKRAISDDEAHKNFDEGLFESKRLAGYTKYYAESQPYVCTLIR